MYCSDIANVVTLGYGTTQGDKGRQGLSSSHKTLSATKHCVCHRWYGSVEFVKQVFVERKTHRESWKGEESVKDRITLPKTKIVEFLDGTYTLDMALKEGKVGAQS